MKKQIFYAALVLAISSISFVACQKEAQDEATASTPAVQAEVGERGPTPPSDPCAQSTVGEGLLAQKLGSITFFRLGWKGGVLDYYANDCVLDGTFDPNCSSVSTASFIGLPQFTYGNFFSNQNAITPAEQQAIVDAALSFAQQNISCEGTVRITAIDFVLSQQGGQINFGVKFQCCPNSGNE